MLLARQLLPEDVVLRADAHFLAEAEEESKGEEKETKGGRFT